MSANRLSAVAMWDSDGVADDVLRYLENRRADEIEQWLDGDLRKLVLTDAADRDIGTVTCPPDLVRTPLYAAVFIREPGERRHHIFSAFPWVERIGFERPPVRREELADVPALESFRSHPEIRFVRGERQWRGLFDTDSTIAPLMQLLMGLDVEVIDEPRDPEPVINDDLASRSLEELLVLSEQLDFLRRRSARRDPTADQIVLDALLLSDDWLGFADAHGLLSWVGERIAEHVAIESERRAGQGPPTIVITSAIDAPVAEDRPGGLHWRWLRRR